MQIDKLIWQGKEGSGDLPAAEAKLAVLTSLAASASCLALAAR